MLKRPIKPSEVEAAKKTVFPPEVFEAFNELIVENFNQGVASVLQKDVVKRIQDKLKCDRNTIFDRGWLNVEEVYAAEGWTVKYDKPGYNEDFEATFDFWKKRG